MAATLVETAGVAPQNDAEAGKVELGALSTSNQPPILQLLSLSLAITVQSRIKTSNVDRRSFHWDNWD